MPAPKRHLVVSYHESEDRYLVIAPRGLYQQRARRLSLTPEDARLLLGQLVGHLKRREAERRSGLR